MKEKIHQVKDCVIDAISEIALNCLNGNIPLTECQYNKLFEYQNILRKLSKKTLVKTRRNLLNQSGGFLQLLIAPALTLLASLIGSYLKN